MKVAFVHKDINVDVNAGGINTVYLSILKNLKKQGLKQLLLHQEMETGHLRGKDIFCH